MEDPGSNPGKGKKTATEQKYLKSNYTGEQTCAHRDHSQILYHCATLFLEDYRQAKDIIQADHLSHLLPV